MKYNRELKGWEKVLSRFQIPYIKFVYSRDAFDDWRIEIYRAYWRFHPKNYHVTEEFYRELRESAHQFYHDWADSMLKRRAMDSSPESFLYKVDQVTGAYVRSGPVTNRDLGDEA